MAGGQEVPATISIGDVEVGDLVFLEDDGSPIGRMIIGLDGSRFSHVGVVVDTGVMASCRTGTLGLDTDSLLEIGGVRVNALADLVSGLRAPHIARRAEPDEVRRQRAAKMLANIKPWIEYGNDPEVDDASDFSLPKLFLVAVALNSYRSTTVGDDRGRLAMRHRALAAAAVWDIANDPDDQPPSFFCSEMIARAAEWTFEAEDLAPPDPPAGAGAAAGVAGAEALPLPDEAALRAWIDGLDLPVGQTEGVRLDRAKAFVAVLRSVWEHDPGMLVASVVALLKFILEKLGASRQWVLDRLLGTIDETEDTEDAALAAGGDLPAALVTPRMLATLGPLLPPRRLVI